MELFFENIHLITYPVAFFGIVYLLYLAGILKAFADFISSWMRSPKQNSRVRNDLDSSVSQRLEKLEDFKLDAEDNHWQTLEYLKTALDKLDNSFTSHRKEVFTELNKQGNRITRLEAKTNINGNK